MSVQRVARAVAASCNRVEARTAAMLFSMSSALQPRVWAMYGNDGNWQPISAKNPSICPATACTPSCPPVMMKPATLLVISRSSCTVMWFCTQFRRSTIL